MKTRKFKLLMIAAMFGLLISGCNKDNNSPSNNNNVMANQQIAQVQNSDVQDAVADKSDQDADNTMDELQSNNYQVSALKSALASGTKVITVDHPDSTTFPKLITIVYTNYQDSTANESFVKNGEIDIYVTAGNDKLLVTRAFTFKAFAVTTDSTTVTVNGTRTVTRTKHLYKYDGLASLRLSVTDNITANLSFSIVQTGQTDSLKFTRVVNKLRTSVLHYNNIGLTTAWKYVKFRNIPALDTITISGTVTGVNEKGNDYSKTVSEATPLVVTFYKLTPIVSSGTMDLTVSGTTASSFTITYKQDLPDHPFMTLVTVTNNTTLKTHSFDRRFGRKFFRWW